MSKGVKNYRQLCIAKTDDSGQRKGEKENVTIFLTLLINSLWSIFSQMWSLSKHANLNIFLFSALSKSFLNHNLVPRGSAVFGIYNFPSLFSINHTWVRTQTEGSVITAVIKRIPNTQNSYPFICLGFIC